MEGLIDVQAASQRLSVSESMVWKLLRKGELTPVKIGTRTLFRPEDLEAFVRNRRRSKPARKEAPAA